MSRIFVDLFHKIFEHYLEMDPYKYYRIAKLFYDFKNFASFSGKNCPGNVTFKDTLILAPVNSVSLGKICQVTIFISQLTIRGILASIIEQLFCKLELNISF